MLFQKFCNILILSIAFISGLNAQTVIGGSESRDWTLRYMSPNYATADNSYVLDYSFSTIHFDNETIIAPTSGGRVIKMNKEMKTLWTSENAGQFDAIAKLGNNVLVVVYNMADRDEYLKTSSIIAKLIDAQSGNIIMEKKIYEDTASYWAGANLCKDSNSNFQYLLIREKIQKNSAYTTSIIRLDNDCNPSLQRGIKTNLQNENMFFAGCVTNNTGDLFLMSRNQNKLVCEKINLGDTKATSILETPIHIGKYGLNSGVIKLNRDNVNEVDIALKYTNAEKDVEVQTVRFDFEKNISNSDELSLEKKLERSISSGYTSRFEIIGLCSYKDKVYTLLEFQSWSTGSTSGSSTTYYTGAILIRAYDKNMGLIKMITFDKDYKRYLPDCPTAGYKILNDRLIILANTNKGLASIFPWYTEVNLETLEFKKPVSIPKTYIEDGIVIDAPATLWFSNTAILQYYTGKIKSPKFMMQKVEF